MSSRFLALRWSALAVILSGLWMLATAHAAPVVADADTRAKTDSPAEKIRKALEQNISLDLADQSLQQAIIQLREQTKLNIVLDRVTLQMMGIAPDEAPATLKVQNVKLRSALRTLLGQYNLGYAIVNDMLVITTEEAAIYRQVNQRVNLELSEVPLKTALRQLAKETATNLVLDTRAAKEGQTPITLTLEDVPLETAVKLLAEMAGLKPARIGNVVFITTEARADKLRADPENGVGPLSPPGGGAYMQRGAVRAIQVDEIPLAPVGRPVAPVPAPALPPPAPPR